MNIQHQNDLESSLYYANKKIYELQKEIELLKKQKQETLNFIEDRCVYDEHLQSYCFPLSKSDVRTLILIITKKQ